MKLDKKVVIVDDYKGRSGFDFWESLNIGDVLEVSIDLKKPFVSCINLVSGKEFISCIEVFLECLSDVEYREY